MLRTTALVAGETYHLYNRGAHKQDIFTKDADYRRFLLLLYLANGDNRVHLSNLLSNKKYQGESLINIYSEAIRGNTLVNVFAYSLMPNHFHLIVQPKTDLATSMFMKKLLTAYSMYFNTKYEHSGVLFQGPFKSRHVNNEAYFRYVFAYVHLNPLSLCEPGWEEKGFADISVARRFVESYPYSSFYDYSNNNRPQKNILAFDEAPPFLRSQNDVDELFEWHTTINIKDSP